ncbi:MAG: aldo/keto reductase [Oribacterium sp.]
MRTEQGLQQLLLEKGVGCIAYSPLAQGSLTDRYLHGIPADSRAARQGTTVAGRYMDAARMKKVRALHMLSEERGQSLAQMALAWVLRGPGVTSALIGASSTSQLRENAGALEGMDFTAEELARIDRILREEPGTMPT